MHITLTSRGEFCIEVLSSFSEIAVFIWGLFRRTLYNYYTVITRQRTDAR